MSTEQLRNTQAPLSFRLRELCPGALGEALVFHFNLHQSGPVVRQAHHAVPVGAWFLSTAIGTQTGATVAVFGIPSSLGCPSVLD